MIALSNYVSSVSIDISHNHLEETDECIVKLCKFSVGNLKLSFLNQNIIMLCILKRTISMRWFF